MESCADAILSTIPEKYRNLIYDCVEGSYINNISKGFKFFSSDIEDKTDDYLFEYLKDKCERCLDDFQNIDNEISQYLSLLGKGYIFFTSTKKQEGPTLQGGD